jgi:hypothetical protein
MCGDILSLRKWLEHVSRTERSEEKSVSVVKKGVEAFLTQKLRARGPPPGAERVE